MEERIRTGSIKYMKNLQAKIDATNKKLKKNRKELWDIQEKNRKLEKELVKLIEEKLEIMRGNVECGRDNI